MIPQNYAIFFCERNHYVIISLSISKHYMLDQTLCGYVRHKLSSRFHATCFRSGTNIISVNVYASIVYCGHGHLPQSMNESVIVPIIKDKNKRVKGRHGSSAEGCFLYHAA